MMMLARIDGKSPVEYLSAQEKSHIRESVIRLMGKNITKLDLLMEGVQHNENKVC